MINNKGQALMESIWTLPCALLIFATILALTYAGFARAWMSYQCDRVLFCLAEGETELECKRTVEKSLKTFLPFGEVQGVQLSALDNHWQANLDWRWGEIHILKQKTLKWDSSLWR
jgi:hypothetical protein